MGLFRLKRGVKTNRHDDSRLGDGDQVFGKRVK